MTSGRPRSISSSNRASSRGCAPGSCRSRSRDRAGSTPHARRRPPRTASGLEERLHVAHHVLVARIVLHRPRLAEHVHQTAIEPAVGNEAGHVGVVAERADVVDVAGAGGHRGLGDGELHRVDRDALDFHQPFDDRDDARELLLDRHRLGARPRGLAADVDDVGALGNQAPAVRDGLGGVVELPAVREGVGRDVDHAHDLESHPLNATGRPEGGGLRAAGGGFRVLPGGGGDAGSGEGGGELSDDGDRVGVGSQGAVGSGSGEGHGEREGVGLPLDT